MKDSRVLFSKRAIEPFKGKYDLPGGFLTYNENAYEACVREIHEETGVVISGADLQLFETYTAEYLPGVSVADLVFIARRWTGDFVAQDDSAALEWHDLSFIDSDKFHPNYTNLANKLREYQPESSIL